MSDVKKQRAYITSGSGKSSLASLRITVNSPSGTAVIRLTYSEEAISWDSAL
ncbi:hypothetical protein [Methanocella sp. MCL-LM]|uniref:hypothetical protein n=1 Tax=Methanocella sp. MCL-LM TaxID=3412035 RepID=UPI003C741FA6